jgi:hypothetical protein
MKIYDTANTKHLTNIIVRLEHVIVNMSKSYRGDVIVINVEGIDNVFVDNNRRKNIDMAKIDPRHPNWYNDNPFPINCTPEINDFKPIWDDNQIQPSINWNEFNRVHASPGITIVTIENPKIHVYKLILSKENTIRLHKKL